MTTTGVSILKIKTSAPSFESLKRLYVSAFPQCERRDEEEWCRMINGEPAMSLYSILPDHPSPIQIEGASGEYISSLSEDAKEGRSSRGSEPPHPAPIGFITAWDLEGFTYIEHFAIADSVRNGGFGTKAIRAFLQAIPQGRAVVLEAEPPESSPLAARRIAFYQRQGFILSDRPYKQPPYSEGGKMIDLKLMSSVPIPSQAAYVAIVSSIYTTVYRYEESGKR